MNNNNENAFDNFLRRQLHNSQSYLEDGDFTAQVMAKIPKAKRLTSWQERLIIIVPCVLISLIVMSQMPIIAYAIKAFVLLSLLSTSTWVLLSMSAFVMSLIAASYFFLIDSKNIY